MYAELVCAALLLAMAQCRPALGLIAHSDWGGQYVGALHQALLMRCGLVGSMCSKGNCWNNTIMDRFFLSLRRSKSGSATAPTKPMQ